MAVSTDARAPLGVQAHPRVEQAREAVVAGLLGAVTIMVWFFIVDLVRGQPLATPTALGTMLARGEQTAAVYAAQVVDMPMVALYTIVHAFCFGVIGLVAVRLFAIAEAHPRWIFGLLLFSVFFFCGFMALVSIIDPDLHQVIPIPAILAGNLLAAAVMGRYLWRRHPLDLSRFM